MSPDSDIAGAVWRSKQWFGDRSDDHRIGVTTISRRNRRGFQEVDEDFDEIDNVP